VVCNLDDIQRIFYHPFTRKVYKFASILQFQFEKYELTDQRMVMTKEKQILNSNNYKINDVSPLQFYHSYYSQFFGGANPFQILSYYHFYDQKIIVELIEGNLNLIQRKGGDANGVGGTIRKMIFGPDPDKVIKNYKFDQDNQYLAIVEQSKVGSYGCLKIFDVSGLEHKIYQKDFSGNEICSQTLTQLNDQSFYISERDVSGGKYTHYLWKITKNSEQFYTISSNFSGCIYANPFFDHFFLDQVVNGRLVIWKYYSNNFILNQVFTDLLDELTFEFNERFIHIKDKDKLYLFANY
jgi:hypothetical protein